MHIIFYNDINMILCCLSCIFCVRLVGKINKDSPFRSWDLLMPLPRWPRSFRRHPDADYPWLVSSGNLKLSLIVIVQKIMLNLLEIARNERHKSIPSDNVISKLILYLEKSGKMIATARLQNLEIFVLSQHEMLYENIHYIQDVSF